jgi:cell fate (sporulation/competence/biofilm development) regulator YlbF (YheA/YmcA/DUF963 family)
MIQSAIDNDAIVKKTRELCQLLLNQPAFQDMRRDIHAFLDDQSAQEHYRSITRRGMELQQKQANGQTLSPDEINGFEQLRTAFMGQPVARAFVEAQQAMNSVQETINRYVSKSFQLGRVPLPEDLECCGHDHDHDHGEGEGCGSGCGCHH